MSDYTPEQLAVVQARNDERFRKMQEDLDRMRSEADLRLNNFLISTESSAMTQVTVSVETWTLIHQLRAKYDTTAFEVPVRVHQSKPSTDWRPLSQWERCPRMETAQFDDVLALTMLDYANTVEEIEDIKYDTYSHVSFTFTCAAHAAAKVRRDFENCLRHETRKLAALADAYLEVEAKERADEQRQCDEYDAYVSQPGAVHIVSRRISGKHVDCVVKNPPSGGIPEYWITEENVRADGVLMRGESRVQANVFLAEYLKNHPEIKAPKELYEY